jgi:hypothetical protein
MQKHRLCSVQDCGKRHYGEGYCQSHWLRWKKHGSPTGGRIPPGEASRFLREVVLAAQQDDCLRWPYATCRGYGQIRLGGKALYVHRVVCQEVYGEPPTSAHQAAHKCGRGHEACVNPRHLQWSTPSENNIDKLDHGTHNRGERQWKAKLTESQARDIRALAGVETRRETAERFGVSESAIANIQIGRAWQWLDHHG